MSLKSLEVCPGNEADPIVVTVEELQAILDGNDEHDVIGIEDDLRGLLRGRYGGTVPIQVHVRYIDYPDAPSIEVAFTADKDFWM